MKIKLLSEGAKVPTKGSDQAAGYDLYTPENFIVNPGRNVIPLNISIALPIGTHGHIRPRSGFSAKGFEGHELNGDNYIIETKRFNCNVLHGVVDSDYRGVVGVIVQSFEDKPFLVSAGTRIAQMVIVRQEDVAFEVVDELDDTARADGGYESTGTH